MVFCMLKYDSWDAGEALRQPWGSDTCIDSLDTQWEALWADNIGHIHTLLTDYVYSPTTKHSVAITNFSVVILYL